MGTPSNKQSHQQTLDWIAEHPTLLEKLERLRLVSQDGTPGIDSLENAETAVLKEVERIGAEALQYWLLAKHDQCLGPALSEPGRRKHSKKNLS